MRTQQATERKARWQLALDEGRVARFNNGETFRTFPSPAAAVLAVKAAQAVGIPANVVEVTHR
jgi:hypothetical protein